MPQVDVVDPAGIVKNLALQDEAYRSMRAATARADAGAEIILNFQSVDCGCIVQPRVILFAMGDG